MCAPLRCHILHKHTPSHLGCAHSSNFQKKNDPLSHFTFHISYLFHPHFNVAPQVAGMFNWTALCLAHFNLVAVKNTAAAAQHNSCSIPIPIEH
jgi:hypothetical protein